MAADLNALKRRAALRAVDAVQNGMTIGLGTGSTAAFVLQEIAARLKDGRLRELAGVPTSEQTRRRAARLGIPLTSLEERPALDLTIDGADEVDPDLNLIKGGHGALLREKLVATVSALRIYVVDETKLSARLCERAPLPVEVATFGWATHLPFLRALGGRPALRTDARGRPICTDEGHFLLDCAFDRIADPEDLQSRLKSRTGILECGLFLGLADRVVVGAATGVEERERRG